MANTDLNYLKHCKILIEEKLKWINSNDWKQRDFLHLIELIGNKTNIALSLSTIKRIWKPDLNSVPKPSTLEALALFLDYDSWLHFKSSNQNITASKIPVTKNINWKRVKQILFSILIVCLIVSAVLFLSKANQIFKVKKIEYRLDEVGFSSRNSNPVGVPNTVIFDYSIGNVIADSFFIQQSWDIRQREGVQKLDSNLTCVYYYPGYHMAKLIANDSIIKETSVQIFTNEWLAMVRDGYMDEMPIYVRNNDIIKNGVLNVSKKQLDNNQINLDNNTMVSYYYVKDFNNISSSDFRFKTKLKCDSIFNFTCPHVTICILGQNDMNILPLTIKGCIGYVNIKIGDNTLNGKNNDLSLFGVNIYEWQEIEIDVKNNTAIIYLNGKEILKLPFNKGIGDIVGFNFNFTGTGSIDFVELENKDNEQVYYTEFESL